MATAALDPRARGESFTDPVAFSETWLCRKLWAKQREIARSVEHNRLTAVKGCHASGKSFVSSGLPLWWLTAHPESKCFQISPTLRQVKVFWAEIATAWKRGRARNWLPEPTTTMIEVAKDRYAYGASSSHGVNVQGLHGPWVLIIADEAPGIEESIWDAIQGIRAGGTVRMLKLGNPTVPAGNFFDSFHKARASHNCISISAFDTPNLQHETEPRPLTLQEIREMSEERLDWQPVEFLISRRWVREMLELWGENHPKFRSRVLAEFPTQSPYAVFELAWIERAKRDPSERELEMARHLPIQVGIDVAGPGDDETALCARAGGIILEQHAWHEPDPIGNVLKVLHSLRTSRSQPLGAIVVDTTGIGYHFARRIADAGFQTQIYGFVAGGRAMDSAQYLNAKSEAYFTAREYFRHGEISGLADDECEAQLSTMLYRETGRGLTEIRSKEDMRKLSLPSPDRAEALIMAFCRIVPREQRVEYAGGYQISPV